MNEQENRKFQARAAVLKALAHPTRLYFVEKLQEGELCVCELAELVDADMSTVSKHLSVLKNVGLVDCRKQGNSIYYTLKIPEMNDVFQYVDDVLENRISEEVTALL